jgi:hypothetical protein
MRKVGWLVICVAVGLMSGILSIAREVLGFWMPQKFPESRLLSTSLVAACAISFGMSWWLENRDKHRIEAQKWEVEKKLLDRRPMLALRMPRKLDGPGMEGMDNISVFNFEHCGGDAARFVQIQPIASVSGRMFLKFNLVDPVVGPVRRPLNFRIEHRNNDPFAFKVVDIPFVFCSDNPNKSPILEYPIEVQFLWNDSQETDRYVMVYRVATKEFEILPPQTLYIKQ